MFLSIAFPFISSSYLVAWTLGMTGGGCGTKWCRATQISPQRSAMHVSRPPPGRFLRGATTSSGHKWSRCFLPTRRTLADAADVPTDGGNAAPSASRDNVVDVSNGWIPRLLLSMGHAMPTEVQKRSFSAILSGRDVVMAAETGSGKTLAYLMPLVARRHDAGAGAPASLVLCPNHALVNQVLEVAKLVAKSTVDLSDALQVAQVHESHAAAADLVVATPSAMRKQLELVGKHRKKQAEWAFSRRFNTLVVDEADMMLTGGYRRDLAHLVDILRKHDRMDTQQGEIPSRNVPADVWNPESEESEVEGDAQRDPDTRSKEGDMEGKEGSSTEEHEQDIQAMNGRQYVFVGATIPKRGKKSIAATLEKKFPDAIWIQGPRLHRPVDRLEQRWYETDLESRMELLQKILQEEQGKATGKRTIVFVNKSTSAASLASRLLQAGFQNVLQYHKEVPREEMMEGLQRFSREEGCIMVATDSASRGLDVPDITHVVQADFAQSAVDYLHRIGRTARAGKNGLVSSMYVEVNKPLVETVREAMEAGLEVEAAFSRNRGFRKKVRKYGKINLRE
uniref:RNA helicase n=1 Tax=Picocystis salinarum TaxID=88271 RepID=A0A7S3XER8_9CHLO